MKNDPAPAVPKPVEVDPTVHDYHVAVAKAIFESWAEKGPLGFLRRRLEKIGAFDDFVAALDHAHAKTLDHVVPRVEEAATKRERDRVLGAVEYVRRCYDRRFRHVTGPFAGALASAIRDSSAAPTKTTLA